MIEKAKIGFYNISACGYFKRNEDAPAFGGIQPTLAQLAQWSNGKVLEDTKLFEPQEGSDALPCYLVDVQGAGDSWVITTWNQTPSHSGKVASIQADSSVGSATVFMNDIKKGSIPGFATYFWVIPSLSKFATVRFQHAAAGQRSFQLYMEAFLQGCSAHVRHGPSSAGGIEILGYSKTPADDPKHYFPRFRTEVYQKPGEHQFLLDHAARIHRIYRKTAIDLGTHEKLAGFQKVLGVLGLRQPQQHSEKVHIRFDADVHLSRDEVKAIIHDWTREHEREWDDYGFDITGQEKVFWLSRSFARDEFDLNVTRTGEELVEAGSLLEALNENRRRILDIL